jgi:hypothetical protein
MEKNAPFIPGNSIIERDGWKNGCKGERIDKWKVGMPA